MPIAYRSFSYDGSPNVGLANDNWRHITNLRNRKLELAAFSTQRKLTLRIFKKSSY